MADSFQTLQEFSLPKGKKGYFHSLPALEKAGLGNISRMPVSVRIVLESVLRNAGNGAVTEQDVKALCAWDAKNTSKAEVPFTVSRIVLQDFTGVPLLVDLAAMRDAVAKLNQDPKLIEPLVPVDLVVDHSVQVDRAGSANAFERNLAIEFERNRERYEFLKWGQQAFDTFSVVPPAVGIIHQVNLEYLAKLVFSKEIDGKEVFYPDTLVGTDSHTTMINGIGIVGWGVGGIEAEAGMLGQPVYFQTPEVIGVNLSGELIEGVTATDLVLRITQMLREEKVVGKFVEFYGEGAESLTVADRATISNMAPEYGATIGFFPVDEKSLDYLRATGRDEEHIQTVKAYYEAQGLFGIPKPGEVDYTKSLDLDLSSIVPSVSGPKRPQDRITVPDLKSRFQQLLEMPAAEGGYGITKEDFDKAVAIEAETAQTSANSGGINELADAPAEDRSQKEMATNRPATVDRPAPPSSRRINKELRHGSVLIAAITSCTNTSNPSVMIAAGLVAKKAIEKGLCVDDTIKASLAPGSRVVTDYLNETGLQTYLDQLGFNLVGYGCTTCIGNSGPLEEHIEKAIEDGNLITSSVLSGNRNFEARIHGAIKANFLMSPPLVVAYALAGNVNIDLTSDPLGKDSDGKDVYLKDIWPTRDEIQQMVLSGLNPEMFKKQYEDVNANNPQWDSIQVTGGETYAWDEKSTYIQQPPFFDGFGKEPGTIEPVSGMRPLLILGDSVTTDHISPAGAIPEDGPAGRYLKENGVEKKDFNSFGSRRGNDRIMTRGTFANVRIKNLMADGREGGWTKLQPEGEPTSVFDAAQTYFERKTPLIVFGGIDYGMGSSRDWAAKGTALLGVRAVVASSFERIHRSNLLGMGVLPLQFPEDVTVETLKLDGTEICSLPELNEDLQPGKPLTLEIERIDGSKESVELICRIDTAIEKQYFKNGGILPYVLRNILQ